MKVTPHIKHKPFAPNEARIINIDENAITELLYEHLMEHKSDYFNTDDITDDIIFCMNWDDKKKVLSYAAVPINLFFEGYDLDFDYLQKNIGITINSLYQPNCYRYKSITITNEMLTKEGQGGQGDGSPVS